MLRKLTLIILLILVGTMITCAVLSHRPTEAKAKSTYTTPSPSTTTTSFQNQSSKAPLNNGGDNTAVIGLIGAALGALATLLAAVITGWLPNHLQQRRAAKQEAQKHEDRNTKAARMAMLRAKNIKERAHIYQRAIHADPRISTIQILDMSQPLDITNIYVRVRVHRGGGLVYKIDQNLREAEENRDPNALLQADTIHREHPFDVALDPVEAISQYTRCVIVGDPGAGKSTLLKYLSLRSVEGKLSKLPPLPIHIELNNFAISETNDLLEFAASVWDRRYNFPKAEALRYMKDNLKEGQAMLLLDALDETVVGKTTEEAEISYGLVENAIMGLATLYEKAPIIVTVRKAGYYQRAKLSGFTELEVLDFRSEDIELFVDKWFTYHTSTEKQINAADLKTRLKRNQRLHSLAANPLLLSLIVIVYEAQLDLPDRRSELYKQCVDVLLTKWDASRNIRRRREFKPEHKRQLLKEVAWYFHCQGRRYFPEDELLNIVAKFLPTIGLSEVQNRDILEEIAFENGLIKEQAHGWHGFLHLTLQEYFTAQYASDFNQLDELLIHRHYPWWEEVLLLYIGLVPDASPLLQYLLEKDHQSGFDLTHWEKSDIVLAGTCLATHPTVKQIVLRKVITSRLLYIIMNIHQVQTSALNRNAVVFIGQTLVQIGGKEVNASLLHMITSDQFNLFLRESLISCLATEPDNFPIEPIAHLLSNPHIERSLAEVIVFTLGILTNRTATPYLMQLLCNPKTDVKLCQNTYIALVRIEGSQIYAYLRRIVADSQTDPLVRNHIINNIFSTFKGSNA